MTIEKLFSRVDKKDGECWIWPHSKDRNGRGSYRGKSAPRAIYEMLHGELPKDIYVCHTCDNPSCVNPDHLWAGTQLENVRDCIEKGRWVSKGQPAGEDHSLAKLTEADVIAIRQRYADGETYQSISVDYCVQSTQIHRIVTGKRWGHIKEGIQKSNPAAARVKPDDFYEIRRRRQAGEKLDDVAAAFGVSIATVSRIANGKVKDPEINQ